MYETDQAVPHSTQPPSYMLPEPCHGARSGVPFTESISRQQNGPVWLDPMNSASVPQQNTQIISSIYPLTPGESTKTYSLLGQPTHPNPSYERALPTPTILPVAHHTLPSQGRETPPLSAASHRSSHTWTTESISNGSVVSSRTSCGGPQDPITVGPAMATYDDQNVSYSCAVGSLSPQLSVPVSSLPAKSEDTETEAEIEATLQTNDRFETRTAQLNGKSADENVRTSSPSLYSCHARTSGRRSHGLFPARLMTTFGGSPLPVTWNPSPSTTPSRHNSVASPVGIFPETGVIDDYNEI